jgi:hypothetical protein
MVPGKTALNEETGQERLYNIIVNMRCSSAKALMTNKGCFWRRSLFPSATLLLIYVSRKMLIKYIPSADEKNKRFPF